MRVSAEDMPQAVRAYLVRYPGASAQQVANILCYSPSSMRRHLSKTGHNLSDIRASVRVDMAKHLIAQGEPAKAVAYDLGYKQPNSLYRLLSQHGLSATELKRSAA